MLTNEPCFIITTYDYTTFIVVINLKWSFKIFKTINHHRLHLKLHALRVGTMQTLKSYV